MIHFSQKEFIRFIINNNVVGFKEEPFTLKSKRKSHWYVNWRTVSNDPFLMDQLTDFVLDYLRNNNLVPDTIYGVPEGATKLGLFTQDKWAKLDGNYSKGSHILSMGRGKPKDHGDSKDKYFIGEPKGKTVILEDVTTTGGSSLENTANVLELSDVEVIAVIGLTNRDELTPIPGKDNEEVVKRFAKIFKRITGKDYNNPMSVGEAFNQADLNYLSLSSAFDFLPQAYAKLSPGENIGRAIEKEFQQYGAKPITLIR